MTIFEIRILGTLLAAIAYVILGWTFDRLTDYYALKQYKRLCAERQ